MPFIEPKRREEYEASGLAALCRTIREKRAEGVWQAGDLAYIVYALLQAAAGGVTRYFQRRDAMAEVDEARLTWRRDVHDPREDYARERNGGIE